MNEQLASIIWDELRRYIQAVDRTEAAEALINILIDNDSSAEDIRAAFGNDKEIKNALQHYLDDDQEVEEEDIEDDYDDDY